MATTSSPAGTTSASWRQEPSYSGWILFAGIIMLTVGFLNVLWGLAAIINDKVIHVGGTGGVVIADYTTWGWIMLCRGVIVALVGSGLLLGWGWARWVGILLVGINALAQFGGISSFPLWSLLMIALSVVVIYQLCVNWNPQHTA